MVNKPQHTDLWERYLFGELSEPEQEQLEEKYFNDDALLIELLAVEDQLIEDFLCQRLPANVRQRFEQRYLTIPGKRQKVELAALAKSYGEQNRQSEGPQIEPSGKTPWFFSILAFFKSFQPRFWIPVLAGLALVSSLTFLIQRQKLPDSITATNQPATAKSQAQLYNPPQAGGSIQPKDQVLGPPLLSVSLPPMSRTRSIEDEGVKTVQTDSATEEIELKLKLKGVHYPAYQGRLQKLDEGGREILRDNALKPSKEGEDRVVLWKVETKQLNIGDYQVELQGVKPGGDLGDTSTYGFNLRGK